MGTDNQDTMTGTSRTDDLRARGGSDTLNARGGNDKLLGDSGIDSLGGAAGNDTYRFADGWGKDSIGVDGGGVDTLDFSALSAGVFVDLVPRADSPEARSGTNTLNLLPVDLIIENVRGGSGVDTVLGNSANNRLLGNGGGDGLYGRDGNDTLVGEAGNDTLIGGMPGDDDYQYPSGNWGSDTITDAAVADNDTFTGNRLIFVGPGAGALTINLISSDAPGAHEVFEGASTINWGGNAIENVDNLRSTGDTINGNDAANFIRSENGVDSVFALGGDDVIDLADDTSSDSNPEGGDTVRCGDGDDTVFYDEGDAVSSLQSSCETQTLVP